MDWVIHTQDVISESHAFLGYIRDAETGQRGYLLTNSPEYLDPYHLGVSSSRISLKKIISLTEDNPDQQALLKQISRKMEEKFSELGTTIHLVGLGEQNEALRIVRSNTGKEIMDQIRYLAEEFIHHEKSLLITRTKAYETHTRAMNQLVIGEIVIFIILLILISIYLQKAVVNPLEVLTKSTNDFSNYSEEFVSSVKSEDEIGKLALAFEKMHSKIREDSQALEQLSEELKQERDKALHASVTDPLTGLYNRRKLDDIAENELKRARRNGENFEVILLDIDFFKAINDNYGHHQGDEVLKKVASSILSMARRPQDFCFRIGGEEFLFISAGKNEKAATSYAEIMRLEVEAMQIPNANSPISDYVTISAGVVTAESDSEENFYDLLKLADERLYIAKSLGRNRVVSTDEG